MGTVSTEHEPAYFTWEAERESFKVRLAHTVLERINVEVMRGFGVTRRRGTEPGGILIGYIDDRESPVVTIDRFESVPCDYAFGPSYILSDNDGMLFRNAMARWKSGGHRSEQAVGFWRAHTREGLTLDEYDLALFEQHFSDPLAVALLIKPYAMRDNSGAFFLQESGALRTTPAAPDFTFTKLGRPSQAPASEPPRPAEFTPPRHAVQRGPILPEVEADEQGAAASVEPEPDLPVTPAALPELPPLRELPPPRIEPPAEPISPTEPIYDAPSFGSYQAIAPNPWKLRAAWVSFTLAAISFGAVGGYEYANGSLGFLGIKDPRPSPLPGLLGGIFSIQADRTTLLVAWNQLSPLVRAAQRGVLTIGEAGGTKTVNLSTVELQSGSIIYHRSSTEVSFRFELFLPDDTTVVHTRVWRAPPVPAP